MNLQALILPVSIAAFFVGALQSPVGAQTDSDGLKPKHPLYGKNEVGSPQIVEYYTPSKAPVSLLAGTVNQLYRQRPHQNVPVYFLPYGETLLIQADSSQMPEVRSLVEQTDLNYVGLGQHEATDEEQFLYKVNYVSLDAVEEALRSMDRNFMQQTQGGVQAQMGVQAPRGVHLGYVRERGMVLVRGSAANVAKVKTILNALDVAPPSLMITCYIVQGRKEKGAVGVPAALVRDLSALVPYEGFELLSSGMLPSNASKELEFNVEFTGERGEFELKMSPSAYDEGKGLLSLSSIKCQMSLFDTIDGKRTRNQRSFSTSTSVATDQFTVLGAVGADPVFVAVRMTQLGN